MTPREQREYVVLGFASTHDALSAEDMLKVAGHHVVPIPAPPVLGAQCGIALRLPPDEVPLAEELLVRGGIGVSARSSIMDV